LQEKGGDAVKFSVFNLILCEYSLEEMLAHLKALGYDGIELRVRDIPPEQVGKPYGPWGNNKFDCNPKWLYEHAEEVSRKIADAGLQIPNLATYLRCDAKDDAIRMAAETCRRMGVPSFRCGPLGRPGPEERFDDVLKRTVEHFRRIVDICRPLGVRPLIECHPGHIAPSASAARRICDNFSPDEIGVIHDPGNMVNEGMEEWAMTCDILGPYLAHVHAKNGILYPTYQKDEAGAFLWKGKGCRMDEGIVHWPTVLKGLKKVGYDGWISNENFSFAAPVLDLLRDDLRYFWNLLSRT
jgi:sugar phosphate isomerase/epimerase